MRYTTLTSAMAAIVLPAVLNAQTAAKQDLTDARLDARVAALETRPAAPASVTARLTSPTQITVTWTAVPGAARYSVSRAYLPAGPTIVNAGLATTTFVDGALKPGSMHVYYVTAISVTGKTSVVATSNQVEVPLPAGTPAPVETRQQMVARAYGAGMAKHPSYRGPDATAWQTIALKSGLAYDDLVNAYDNIWVLYFAYNKLLNRLPDSAGTVSALAAMKNGYTWQAVWRGVAQSPEREQKFGYWAPAPVNSVDEARRVFGLGSITHPEQCFGGLGDRCEGGIPTQVNDQVQPRWSNQFTLPDGTVMGYVDIGVAVGSILHDNACLRNSAGQYCSGINLGSVGADLVKNGGPAANEWNKASWNVIDHRTWRATFGPYPVDQGVRQASWYDDVRPVANREAWMAGAVSIITTPNQTIQYTGGETKRSAQLSAPSGTPLDSKDAAFCQSKSFSKIDSPFGKAPVGTCR